MYGHLRLRAAFASTPWALEVGMLEALIAYFSRSGASTAAGDAPGGILARGPASRAQTVPGAGGNVAVIPVTGLIAHRASMMDTLCAGIGTSAEATDRAIRAAAADPSIRSIVLDIDSPGGSVFGVQELAQTIFDARQAKPIAAVANARAESAAYWIASAAHELFVTGSGEVGSIGVLAVHTDATRADERAGRKTTLIKAGKYKAETEGPLGQDARAFLQSRVDDYFSAFVRQVARHRGVSVETVRGQYGQGRTLGAQAALAAGMVDGVATLQEVVGRYARRTVETANRSRALSAASSSVHARTADHLEGYRARIALAAARAPTPRR